MHTAKKKRTINELRNVNERLIPLFPAFIPFDRVWEFTLDNDTHVDVIGMVLFVSSMGYKDGFYNRRIPVRNIVLLDDTYVYLMIFSYRNDLVTNNLSAREKLAQERIIVVATMLRAERIDRGLHTTDLSRMHFNPNITVVRELRQRINNDLPGQSPP
ncbi:uncharacterized protein [Aegilops tauschii subsp. strangulata]|uniref:uncharacterized protein n=1 Tax=Aegilops tauschii subsp. strangulata TaxID=200361 RepID=UPI001ABC26FE|nr:uncharacterized protein LOC120975939 [Aegilops tauschii subsp. strangulata]